MTSNLKINGLLLFLLAVPLGLLAQHTSTTSALAEGKWSKVCVSDDGIYKIDRAMMQDMGFSVSSINPQNIQIYGRGGGMLPQSNNTPRYDDLYENAISVTGESDGSFDNNDVIYFHGESPNEEILSGASISHQVNYYTTETCYFITVGQSAGKRITSLNNDGLVADASYTSFDEYIWKEWEEENVITSGREWFGDDLRGGESFETTLALPNKISGSSYNVTIDAMAMAAETVTSFNVKINNTSRDAISCAASRSGYGLKGRNCSKQYTVENNSGAMDFQLTYNNAGKADAKGFPDYISVAYERELKLGTTPLFFQKLASENVGAAQYAISGATSSTKVWDITNSEDPKLVSGTLSGGVFTFIAEAGEIRKYAAFNNSQAIIPNFKGSVANQDLHGITNSPDLLIITHSDFYDQAERLAAHRRSEDGYTVEVATVQQVYNEFSSGTQDITAIRDFAKMLYDRGGLRYLLLMGDGSYDYKNITGTNGNFVPLYEARESLDNIKSYSSDDFYGFMESNEGMWIEGGTSTNHTLEIGVGRLPVSSAFEAENVVNKLISYNNEIATFGKWRNRICFVSDDGDSNLHLNDADELTDMLQASNPEYLPKKMYLDAYEQVSSSSGEVAPELNKAFNEQIDKGALIVNYTGHGGEQGWAQENILNIPQIQSWSNSNKLPLFVTATCEFGRNDDPERKSGAELTLLNPEGGAIGMVSTTRPVYAHANAKLSKQFYNRVFLRLDDGSFPAVGDILRLTKNNSFDGVNNRNFSLLGDPSLVLAYPVQEVEVTQFNNLDVTTSQTDTVGALQYINVKGQINDGITGVLDADFNGVLYATVLDKPVKVTTLGNEKYSSGAPEITTFYRQESTLFDGKASVVGGKFDFDFILPKDIDYNLGEGKISFYAVNENYTVDANGSYDDFYVGGSASDIVVDNEPPSVKMYLNDTTFTNGGAIQDEAVFIAYVYDESGINTSNAGIGHEITLTIDGKSSNTIVLNEFYESDIDNFRSGVVTYNLSELPEGEHFIVFKVWDTYNNSKTDTLHFVIGDPATLGIYKNPFDDMTEIDVIQQRSGEPLNVTIEIYALSAEMVWYQEYYYDSAPSTLQDIEWDGRTNARGELPDGVYILKVVLEYPSDGLTLMESSKLVIVR